AAESITVRGTTAGSRRCATDAAATSSASTDVPFATGDASGTYATTTADVVVVSAGATSAVAGDKQAIKSGVQWYWYHRLSSKANETSKQLRKDGSPNTRQHVLL
ncbi:hypothetical protein LSAT2_029918, partial [Lamellibrachia satsuma]